MKLLKRNEEIITLEISKHELGILGNALNEVCNGIELWEFDTRMGITIDEAMNILRNTIAIYEDK